MKVNYLLFISIFLKISVFGQSNFSNKKDKVNDTLINDSKNRIGFEIFNNALTLLSTVSEHKDNKPSYCKLTVSHGLKLHKNFWLNSKIGYWNNIKIKGTTNYWKFENKGLYLKTGPEYIFIEPIEKDMNIGFYFRQGISSNNIHSTYIYKDDYWGDYQKSYQDKFTYTWSELGTNVYFLLPKSNIYINLNFELAFQNKTFIKNYDVRHLVGYGVLYNNDQNKLKFLPKLFYEVGWFF